jgi:hypothetical protein
MQVNSEMATLVGVTPEQLFEPYTNVRIGARILVAAYATQASELGKVLQLSTGLFRSTTLAVLEWASTTAMSQLFTLTRQRIGDR